MAGTGWKPGERPEWVKATIDGVVDPLLEVARERFDPDQMCEEAQLITGLDDLGQDDFREPLEIACRSAEAEADLHVVGGRARFREMVLRLLAGRLRILEYVRRDPGVLDEQIVAPGRRDRQPALRFVDPAPVVGTAPGSARAAVVGVLPS